jgi:uncharacterized protein (DUF849 family)
MVGHANPDRRGIVRAVPGTRERVIISCAVTGAIHVPSMTPHLPITPEQIAASAIGASAAGAAIVHLHARDAATGRPSHDPAVFSQFLPQIHAGAAAVINITTGAGQGMTLEERTAAARAFSPELCSLNMGSMNFATFPMIDGIAHFQHDWERDYLERSRDYVFRNTFHDIEWIVRTLSEQGTRFEFECYDIGHLYTLAHFVDAGVIAPPFFIQTVFGILGGIAADVESLMHARATADRLFGGDYQWSVLGAGRHQTRLATVGAIAGAHVRVGLEDSVYLERGVLAQTNAQQVEKIVRILRELSLEPASPDEARALLSLKGAAATAIGG